MSGRRIKGVAACGSEVLIYFDRHPDPGQWYCRSRDGAWAIVFGLGTTVQQIEDAGVSIFPGDKARLLQHERRLEQVEAAYLDDLFWVDSFNQVAERNLSCHEPPAARSE